MADRAGRQILTGEEMDRVLEEMAAAIYEQAPDKDNLVLVGIRTGGVARRLLELLERRVASHVTQFIAQFFGDVCQVLQRLVAS